LTVKEKLDSVGQGFCPQKWRWLALYLHSGDKHSCHHPWPRIIPLEELENPASLHNTKYEKEQRRLMLAGERPAGCSYCWNIEDINKTSDRVYKNTDSINNLFVLDEEIELLRNTPWDKDVNPYNMEISFSNACNFKCGYCCSSFSSLWEQELEQFGDYDISDSPYGTRGKKIYSEKEYNPYVEAFWKWWPDLKNDLKIFRITGGEPLMTANTFKLLDMLKDDGNPDLFLQINTNLGVTNRKVVDFCRRAQELIEKNHIKNLRLFTSIECTGKQAEYIRRGLNYELFLQNVNSVLETVPTAYLSFMTTYNVLTVPYFNDFLQLIIELRQKWGDRILIDIPHLKEPPHWTMNILPKEFGRYIDRDVEFMRSNGFSDIEIGKMERIRDYFYNDEHAITEDYRLNARQNFAKFFPEYDKRSNSNLIEVFPEMSEFLDWCKTL
jgi:organic radical activating enzyme